MARKKKWASQAEYRKWWNEQHKERIKEQKAEYYKENKQKYREGSLRRKKENRLKAIEMLGGKCVDCGITENLEFDHIDPCTKEKNVCNYLNTPSKLFEEVKKCELRCKKCHRERTNKQLRLAWRLLSIIPEHQRRMLYLQPPADLAELQSLLQSSDITP